VAVVMRRSEARRERGQRKRPAPRPEVEDCAALGKAKAHEPVVQVACVGHVDRLAAAQPLRDDERRIDDRHGEH